MTNGCELFRRAVQLGLYPVGGAGDRHDVDGPVPHEAGGQRQAILDALPVIDEPSAPIGFLNFLLESSFGSNGFIPTAIRLYPRWPIRAYRLI